jgi:hypothetical protein
MLALILNPCLPAQPQVVFVRLPLSWMPIAVGAAQSVFALCLTYYIFRNNAKQKIAERHATWFHKVAVDPSVGKCFDYFGAEVSLLEAAASECERLKYAAGNDPAMDGVVRARLKEFRGRLRPARNGVSDLASVFDAHLRQTIFDRFNKFEDDVAGWFDNLQSSNAVDPRSSLPTVVTSCQSDILKILKDYEFEKFRG